MVQCQISLVICPNCKVGVDSHTDDQCRVCLVKIAGNSLELPSWIPLELWAEYEEMRKKIRKPMTPAAKKLAINKLISFRARGISVQKVLENSIFNSYQGLFEPYGQTNGSTSKADRRAADVAETTKRVFDSDPFFHSDNGGCVQDKAIGEGKGVVEGHSEGLFIRRVRERDD